MKKQLFVFFLTISTSTFAQQAENEGIKSSIQQFFDGMRKADTSMIKAVVNPKCKMMTSYFDRNNNPQLRFEDNMNGFMKSIGSPHPDIYDERLTTMDIKIDDNLALVWANYEFYVGKTFSHDGVDIFTLAKENGSWKIVSIADTRRKKK